MVFSRRLPSRWLVRGRCRDRNPREHRFGLTMGKASRELEQPPYLTHEVEYDRASQFHMWLKHLAEVFLPNWPAIILGIGGLLFGFGVEKEYIAITVLLAALVLGILRYIWWLNTQRQVDGLAKDVSDAIDRLPLSGPC